MFVYRKEKGRKEFCWWLLRSVRRSKYKSPSIYTANQTTGNGNESNKLFLSFYTFSVVVVVR